MVNARAQNRLMEAKVGIVFSHQPVVGTNRRQLLNKQYVGTLQSVQAFSQQLFTMARSMDIDNQDQLVILSMEPGGLTSWLRLNIQNPA